MISVHVIAYGGRVGDEEEEHSITDEPEEQEVDRIDSISQLNIIGRTQEQTHLIKEILSKHEEEMLSSFRM